jgi:hypothetical protein
MYDALTEIDIDTLCAVLCRGWLRAARYGKDVKGSYDVSQEIRANLSELEAMRLS